MSLLASALCAFAFAAAPYPPPKLAPVTDHLKSDTGVVVAADVAVGQLRVSTPAGLVVYKVPGDMQVLGADAKPAGNVAGLKAGQRIRIYFVVDDGAKVSEVDLE